MVMEARAAAKAGRTIPNLLFKERTFTTSTLQVDLNLREK